MKKIFLNLFVFLAGMVLFFIGVYQIYPPAAFGLTGLILMIISTIGEGKR
jgi:membrane-bound ClpP family serine protease